MLTTLSIGGDVFVFDAVHAPLWCLQTVLMVCWALMFDHVNRAPQSIQVHPAACHLAWCFAQSGMTFDKALLCVDAFFLCRSLTAP